MLTTSLLKRFSISTTLIITLTLVFCTTGQTGPYLDSGHGGYGTPLRGVTRLAGYAEGNCAHCHEQHASIDGSEPAPVKPGPSESLLFADLANNNFCNYCHDSNQSNGADNIASQIAKTNSHDPNSIIGPVLCGDCHDSHIAQTTTHRDDSPVGNNVSGAILSVSGVSATWVAPAAPIPGTENLNNPTTLNNLDPITMEYQLCLKCHGGQVGYAGLANLARTFNPNLYSVHPVTTSAWKNSFLWSNFGTALVAPWNAANDTQMYCSDCHGSDNSPADPAGPHGSVNTDMLTDIGPGATYDNLCTRCHNVASSAWVSENQGYAAGRDHDFASHQWPANVLGCLACHGGIGGPLESNIHGANYVWPDEAGDPGRASEFFLVGGLITKNYYVGIDVRGNRRCAGVAGGCHTGGAAYNY